MRWDKADNDLFGIIYAVTDKPTWAVSEVHDAILAAGYCKQRTITTIEELREVHDGTIVRTANGLTGEAITYRDGRRILRFLGSANVPSAPLLRHLPATVLHEGQA